jgi:Domain of unknown function (DUF1877)
MGMVLYLRRMVDDAVPDDPEAFYEDFFFSEEAEAAGDLIDFDKAWHALHFLLTGSADETDDPLCLYGRGRPIAEDNGYGPPLLMSAEEMRAFHDAFAVLSDDELRRRYDPKAMLSAGIYMADALVDGAEGWDYVSQGIPALRRFAERCVQQGSGAIALIS